MSGSISPREKKNLFRIEERKIKNTHSHSVVIFFIYFVSPNQYTRIFGVYEKKERNRVPTHNLNFHTL